MSGTRLIVANSVVPIANPPIASAKWTRATGVVRGALTDMGAQLVMLHCSVNRPGCTYECSRRNRASTRSDGLRLNIDAKTPVH
jgi:hypothetical protein